MHQRKLAELGESVDGSTDFCLPGSHRAELCRYRPRDAPAVIAAYMLLSPDSFYQRFFALVPNRSAFVAPLLERVDHRNHELFLAWVDARVVGLAQWDRSRTNPRAVEVGLVVTDAWQGRGIGRRLIAAVAADARRQGAADVHADIMTANRKAVNLALSIGPTDIEVDGPEIRLTFSLMVRHS